MPTQHPYGRHEYGQNFLTDPSTIATITRLVAATRGPIVEIGPGDGAITRPLATLQRPLTAVEIDPRLATRLKRTAPPHVEVVTGDFLQFRLPDAPHVLVGNLPFHQTTAMLRRILAAPAWADAILLTQWEVARRRAGVGNATMMTAQWSPWFRFELIGRVPAKAFTPRPGVDGGLLTIQRHPEPEIRLNQRRQFHRLVQDVYTGPGRGLSQILARNTSLGSEREATSWLAGHGLSPHGLPRNIPASAWIDLFKTTGASPPRTARAAQRRDRGRRRQG